MNKALIILCIFLTLPVTSYAKKLEIKKCPNFKELENCSNKCKNVGYFVDFLIKKDNTVIRLDYDKEKTLTNTVPLQNCHVINKDNWVCKNTNMLGTKTERRIDGVYHKTSNDIQAKVESMFCAK